MDAWRYGIYLLVFTFDISLVRYRCEHSKINSISPRDHVLFSISLPLMQFFFTACANLDHFQQAPSSFAWGHFPVPSLWYLIPCCTIYSVNSVAMNRVPLLDATLSCRPCLANISWRLEMTLETTVDLRMFIS